MILAQSRWRQAQKFKITLSYTVTPREPRIGQSLKKRKVLPTFGQTGDIFINNTDIHLSQGAPQLESLEQVAQGLPKAVPAPQ